MLNVRYFGAFGFSVDKKRTKCTKKDDGFHTLLYIDIYILFIYNDFGRGKIRMFVIMIRNIISKMR